MRREKLPKRKGRTKLKKMTEIRYHVSHSHTGSGSVGPNVHHVGTELGCMGDYRGHSENGY